MNYSPETLKKVVSNLKEKTTFYRELFRKEPSSVQVCISRGNRKIGRTLNVSLAPVITCCNCSGCASLCYDVKACLMYTSVVNARARNTAILMEDRKLYFDSIRQACAKRTKRKFFRWHVAGDIPDYNYFENMIAIAKDFPDFKFWTYTKNYFVINAYCKVNGKESIPENLKIMFSEWRGMPMINPYNFPEFKVVFKDEEKPQNVNWCPGCCDVCIACNSHCVNGQTVFCEEH